MSNIPLSLLLDLGWIPGGGDDVVKFGSKPLRAPYLLGGDPAWEDLSIVTAPAYTGKYVMLAEKSLGKTDMQGAVEQYFNGEVASVTWDTAYLQLPKDKNTLQMVENHLSSFYEEPVDFKLKTSLALINSEVTLTPFQLNWDNFPKLSSQSKGIYKEAIK